MEKAPNQDFSDKDFLDNLAWAEFQGEFRSEENYVELVEDASITNKFKLLAVDYLIEKGYFNRHKNADKLRGLALTDLGIGISKILCNKMDELSTSIKQGKINSRVQKLDGFRNLNNDIISVLPSLPVEEAETLLERFQIDCGEYDGDYHVNKRLFEDPDIHIRYKEKIAKVFKDRITDEKGKPKRVVEKVAFFTRGKVKRELADTFSHYSDIIQSLIKKSSYSNLGAEEFIRSEMDFLMQNGYGREIFWDKGALVALSNVIDNKEFVLKILRNELLGKSEASRFSISTEYARELRYILATKYDGDKDLIEVLMKVESDRSRVNDEYKDINDFMALKKSALLDRFRKDKNFDTDENQI